DLVSWVGIPKPCSTEALVYNGHPCTTVEETFNAFHNTFLSALNRPVSLLKVDECLPLSETQEWPPFSLYELKSSLAPCADNAPGRDHISWRFLKDIIHDHKVADALLWIANACFDSGIWPVHFKISDTAIIPKPNKDSYDVPKSFRPIVLLSTVGKLFEKMITNRLQYDVAAFQLLHRLQFGGVRQHSTEDAGCFLSH